MGVPIVLSPEDEALVAEKVRSGEFGSREAVVAYALRRLSAARESAPRDAGEECARALEGLFAEIDADPAPGGPLPPDALTREGFLDPDRTRLRRE